MSVMKARENGAQGAVERSAMIGLELRHLRAFVAVAEELHFRRAAERLFIGQQALSVQIRQLERLVGVELFSRTTRRVALTEAGQALMEYAPAVLTLVDDGFRSAQGRAPGARGVVRVGYPASMNAMPAIIEAIHRQFPALRVAARQMWAQEAIAGVAHDTLDLAYVRRLPDDPTLESVLVGTEPFSVTVGACHALAARGVVAAEELCGSVLLLWQRELSPQYFDLLAAAFHRNVEAGLLHEYWNHAPGGYLEDPRAEALLAGGTACCPRIVSEGDRAPEGFVDLRLEPAVSANLYLVCRRGPAAQARFDPILRLTRALWSAAGAVVVASPSRH